MEQNKNDQQAEKMDERVILIDENNEVKGVVTRAEMREKILWHRSTCIFLMNSKHKDKKWAPSHWSTGFGGVIAEGEDYDDNALKELQEEAGITTKLIPLFMNKFESNQNKGWQKCYLGYYDGPITIQQSEIEKYELMSIQLIKERRKTEKFAPDTNKAFDLLCEYLNKEKLLEINK